MIVVIDYGMGNVGSIVNMMKKLGHQCLVTRDHSEIKKARALIFPGVGAYDSGMAQLKEKNLIPVLEEMVLSKRTPFLGICLGMQLLLDKSEEGHSSGLGWIPGEVVRFNNIDGNNKLRVPHMGWNEIQKTQAIGLTDMRSNEDNRYYFVHSYHVTCEPAYVAATTYYGYKFPSLIKRDNIWGAQFHPEKSHKFGFSFFNDFLREAKCLEQE